MEKYIRRFTVIFGILTFILLGAGIILANELPDTFQVTEGNTLKLSGGLPVTSVADDSVTAQSNMKAGLRYSSELKLLGLVQIKNVSVSVVKPTYVVPGGEVFGVKLYTEGVMVIGMTDVDTPDGPHNPSYDAGIRKGDIIIAINGKSVNSNDEVGTVFSQSGGKELTVSVKRGTTGFEVKVKPALSNSEKAYKAGMWVRDSTAGIGTITYYNPDTGVFGGLGHAVCDIDTGEILPLLSGEAVKADLSDIVKGSKGKTGELEGTLEETTIGSLLLNNQTGVFGVLKSGIPTDKSIPMAMCQQVHRGGAQIVSTIDSTGPHAYSVTIDSVNYDTKSPTKNMVVKITDRRLISKTGGIVQGMSGSPIIQDGYLIGALTHVFVNDPLTGYGIFAENMQKSSKTLEILYKSGVS